MKRILYLLLTAVLAATAAACDSDEKDNGAAELSAPQLYPIAGWSESNTPYIPGTMMESIFMNTPYIDTAPSPPNRRMNVFISMDVILPEVLFKKLGKPCLIISPSVAVTFPG